MSKIKYYESTLETCYYITYTETNLSRSGWFLFRFV
jgi:hypothetical protein